jgi:YD repeat-containing protein
MTAVVDAINQRYEFVYDPLGRVTQNKKGAMTMSFVYDAAGNRSQRTDYNGAVTNYSYDALNRLTTLSYDDVGNRTASHQGSSSTLRLQSISCSKRHIVRVCDQRQPDFRGQFGPAVGVTRGMITID